MSINDPVVSSAPSVNRKRSTFRLDHSYKTTFNSGRLIPIYMEECIAGDTFKIDTAFVCRMLTPVVPVMDNAYLDIWFFFVPFRICMNQYGQDDKTFQKVFGENTSSAWSNVGQNNVVPSANVGAIASAMPKPSVSDPSVSVPLSSSTVWDYFGLPLIFSGTPSHPEPSINGNYIPSTFSISVAPAFAYQLIWNEFFRDENSQNPSYKSSVDVYASEPFKVCKFHDLYTSALPAPQKGPDVYINQIADTLNVVADTVSHSTGNSVQLGSKSFPSSGSYYPIGSVGGGYIREFLTNVSIPHAGSNSIDSTNLVVKTGADQSATIDQFRYALALSNVYERDARFGTRYREVLRGQYGVNPSDGLLDVPQYLGGSHVPINMDTVLQTSATSGNSALGDTGAFSNTFGTSKPVSFSAQEPGLIIGVCAVRTEQSYFQGIPKVFSHLHRFDFYNPAFADIGEQPIMRNEIYFDGSNSVFGYQEAWYEYRNHDNRVTGRLNPQAGDVTLHPWTYAESFSKAPVLNSDFMVQSEKNIGDTLVDTHSTTQFVSNFRFNVIASRIMPLYSVPSSLLGRY